MISRLQSDPTLLHRYPGAAVAGAVIFGQVCLIFALPFLTRAYSVVEFASYQVAFSIAVVLQTVITAGNESLIPCQRDDRGVTRVQRSAVKCVIASAAVLGGLAALLLIGRQASAGLIALNALIVAVAFASTAIDNAVLISRSDAGTLIIRNLCSGVLGVALQLTAAHVSAPTVWLAVALLVARIVSQCLIRSRRTASRNRRLSAEDLPTEEVSSRRWTTTAQWTLANLLANVSMQAPVVIAMLILDMAAAAQLAMAIRLVGALATLVGGGVSQGFIFELKHRLAHSPHKAFSFFKQRQRALGATSMACGVLITILAPWTVPLVFGQNWTPAGTVAAVLGIPFALQLANRVVTPAFPLMGPSYINKLLRVQAIRVGLVLATFLIGGLTVARSLISLSCILAVAMTVFHFYFYRLATSSARRSWARSDVCVP